MGQVGPGPTSAQGPGEPKRAHVEPGPKFGLGPELCAVEFVFFHDFIKQFTEMRSSVFVFQTMCVCIAQHVAASVLNTFLK